MSDALSKLSDEEKQAMRAQAQRLADRMKTHTQDVLSTDRAKKWQQIYDWTVAYRKENKLTTKQFMGLCGVEKSVYYQRLQYCSQTVHEGNVCIVANNRGYSSDILEKLLPFFETPSLLSERPVPKARLVDVMQDEFEQRKDAEIYSLIESSYLLNIFFGDHENKGMFGAECPPDHVGISFGFTGGIKEDVRYTIKYRMIRMCQDVLPPNIKIITRDVEMMLL